MPRWIRIFLGSILVVPVALAVASAQEPNPPRTIKRVARPDFDDGSWEGVFFDDLMEQGLSGARPARTKATDKISNGDSKANGSPQNWSTLISRDTIEDEIKLVHRKLLPGVASPGKFNTKFQNVRQNFSMLSIWFGIVSEYDRDIRWQKFSRTAQQTFADSVSKSKTASAAVYQTARRSTDMLSELVRGESITVAKPDAIKLSWPKTANRRAVMLRLDDAVYEALGPGTSSEFELRSMSGELTRHAEVVAALAEVLVKDSMPGTEHGSYVDFSQAMGKAARQLRSAVEEIDYELAVQSVEAIERSCADCHGEWR